MTGTQLEFPEPASTQGLVTKVVTVFEGTENELVFEIDVMGWRGWVTGIRPLSRNNMDASPVPESR